MNVMYFEHNDSVFFNNADEESIEVHNVTPNHMAQLMRNLVCCGNSKMVLEDLDTNSVRNLRECMHKLTDMFEKYYHTESADANTMRGAD